MKSDYEETIQILKYGTVDDSQQSDVWSKLPPANEFISGALRFSVTRQELEAYRKEYAKNAMKKLQL